jgi:hypothetical protein
MLPCINTRSPHEDGNVPVRLFFCSHLKPNATKPPSLPCSRGSTDRDFDIHLKLHKQMLVEIQQSGNRWRSHIQQINPAPLHIPVYLSHANSFNVLPSFKYLRRSLVTILPRYNIPRYTANLVITAGVIV